jgi:hypothetical protein
VLPSSEAKNWHGGCTSERGAADGTAAAREVAIAHCVTPRSAASATPCACGRRHAGALARTGAHGEIAEADVLRAASPSGRVRRDLFGDARVAEVAVNTLPRPRGGATFYKLPGYRALRDHAVEFLPRRSRTPARDAPPPRLDAKASTEVQPPAEWPAPAMVAD